MANIITICGYSGGKEGPQSIYNEFFKTRKYTDFSYVPYTTLKDNLLKNAEKVGELVKKSFLSTNKGSILIGHSSGGAVALVAAHNLINENNLYLNGVVLINPQTDGLNILQDLKIPLLVIYGQNDSYFTQSEIEYYFNTHEGSKQMILMPDLGHDLEYKNSKKSYEHTDTLAKIILEQIHSFFIDNKLNSDHSIKNITIPKKTTKRSNESCVIL